MLRVQGQAERRCDNPVDESIIGARLFYASWSLRISFRPSDQECREGPDGAVGSMVD